MPDECSPFVVNKSRIMHIDNKNLSSPGYVLEYSWRLYNYYHLAYKATFKEIIVFCCSAWLRLRLKLLLYYSEGICQSTTI